MKGTEEVTHSLFYQEINTLLRKELSIIKNEINLSYEQLLSKKQFKNPLSIICQFEFTGRALNRQWRLELDFDNYQWSNKTIKPHFLMALVNIETSKETIYFKHQLCSSFNDASLPMESEKIELQKLNDTVFVSSKIHELKQFLEQLSEAFLQEIEKINFNELEYMMHPKIQEKWKQGFLPGFDCIIMGEGELIIGNVYSTYDPSNSETKQYWSPLCDTTIESIEKYDDDTWVEVDIFHGAFEYKNQKFVFGDGGMGNEGYIASITLNNELNWAIFFTFSNPINKAKVKSEHLICYGDTGTIIDIDLNNITKIKISHRDR